MAFVTVVKSVSAMVRTAPPIPVCVVGTDSVTRPVSVNAVGPGVGLGVGCGVGAVGAVGIVGEGPPSVQPLPMTQAAAKTTARARFLNRPRCLWTTF